ncbi:hypothetical protein [Curtobacterium sp. PsM8]|uniref:hypothetical protein n=1 Tax=Curtobacterium sp. PsM8 TaxID=3030532 RepID=UPI00263BE4AC|nr:hypothetical protein [Curtobacterium sp. PsM8]MDN4649257.1 hypothetical protein [Curtobacterium sp. PsM8]
MNGLDTRPIRPPLPIFETLGHWCVGLAVVAAVVAIAGIVGWFTVPRARHSPVIVRLWIGCAIVGVIAIVFAILLLA